MSPTALRSEMDRLLELSDTLAGAWAGRAAASTTVGQERAILRLCGVSGVDAQGRPLAAEVVDRYIGSNTGRLASGILLPFAVALLEYDTTPQDLALDIAAGAVDLALESDVMHDPTRRAGAQAEAARLAGAAAERIDANRTARRELQGLLGELPTPWFGITLAQAELTHAQPEAVEAIAAGADLVRVPVPAGRELSARAQARSETSDRSRARSMGFDVDAARARRGSAPYGRPSLEGIPAGSQRGLAELRRTIDETAAGRRRYVRLATLAPALAAPELGVVAGFERVDVVELDPIAEIVDEGVDPDRALADHAFAHRLLRRAGVQVLVGPGPARRCAGSRSRDALDPGTRAGRALALQLLSVALARHHGLSAEQILVSALPPWISDERNPAVQAVAQVAVRRALFSAHALAFDEPAMSTASEGWPFVFAAAVPGSDPTALVLRRAEPGRIRQVGEATRAAARVGREILAALGPRTLHGPALEHAEAVVGAARDLLERLANEGWRAVIGASIEPSDQARTGWDLVVERSEDVDPFALDQPAVARNL